MRSHKGKDAAPQKRERAPDVFELVQTKRFRTAMDLKEHACEEAAAGRPALAQWCTRRGGMVQEFIDNAWGVLDAPQRALRSKRTRTEILQAAARDLRCVCGGVWRAGAESILAANNIDKHDFCKAVCRALSLGAVRGANVACVGRGGCGKSTLFEPLEEIYVCAEKPQGGSTFPFGTVPDCDVLLWQDYEHDEDTVRFSDLLGLLVGEAVGVRVPGRLNVKLRNKAPLFYSARAEMCCRRKDKEAEGMLNDMMDDRFTFFRFTSPLPRSTRRADFPKCGKCCAAFLATGVEASAADANHAAPDGADQVGSLPTAQPGCGSTLVPSVAAALPAPVLPLQSFASPVAPGPAQTSSSLAVPAPARDLMMMEDAPPSSGHWAPQSQLAAALRDAAAMHRAGALGGDEFTVLKAKLLAQTDSTHVMHLMGGMQEAIGMRRSDILTAHEFSQYKAKLLAPPA